MNAQEIAGMKKREQLRSMIEAIKLTDLMTKGFDTVSPEEQLSDVLKRMGQLDLHEMPVSLDGKRLMGVVSYGTLLKRRNLPITTKAGSIAVMPQEITPDTLVTEAAEAFMGSDLVKSIGNAQNSHEPPTVRLLHIDLVLRNGL